MRTPSQQEVEDCIRGLQMDEPEAKDLLAFYRRERKQEHLSLGWRFLIAFCTVALATFLLYWYVVAPALAALTGTD